jgi:hypothetical protein
LSVVFFQQQSGQVSVSGKNRKVLLLPRSIIAMMDACESRIERLNRRIETREIA